MMAFVFFFKNALLCIYSQIVDFSKISTKAKDQEKERSFYEKEVLGEKIMTMHNGNKLCQWCRKMFPKKEVRFYPKPSMKMRSNCVEVWRAKFS
jgi:hypothetical protein